MARPKLFHLFLLAVFSLLTYSHTLLAQNNTVTGKVTEKFTREGLPGATVLIENTTKGTSTNLYGEYRLANIKEDKVRLHFSFIGFEPQTIDADFTGQDKLNIDVVLIPLATQLEQVQITGDASGQVKALIEQKKAENIKNVVSAEQIEQFPDMNAAEAMQRIPGITLQRDQGEGRYVQLRGTPPELTNFNINGEQIPSPEGNVRYVGMDIISADQIEIIEITKVLTPDMDADGIGGTVNIITKKAESEKPEIDATLAGGYNNLRGTNNYQIQFSYGQRYGNFGFNMNSSYYVNNQGADNMEFKYAKGPFWGSQQDSIDNYYVQYREVQLRYYDITRKRMGLSATLDYRFNDNSTVYLRGMFNNFSDNETRYRKIYDLDDAISMKYYLYGGIKHDVKRRTKIQNINTINLGGEHIAGPFKIDYELAYAIATEDQPDRIEAQFDNPGQAIAIKFNLDDPDWPKPYFPNPENAQNAYAYDEYEMDDLIFELHEVTDQNYTAKLNIELPFVFKNHEGYFKFGGKSRFKEKKRDIFAEHYGAYFETSNIYPGEGPPLSLVTVNDGFYISDFLKHGYELEYMPSASKMKDFFEYWPQFFIYDRTGTKTQSYGSDYTAFEDIYAGYAMFRYDIYNLMILGGIRFERTDIDYTGRLIITENGKFRDMDTLTDKRTHEFLLPQFQLKYAVNEALNLRAAITYTYSRPNFEDVLPYREEDYDEVRYGNPDLKFPESMNIDFLGEYYLSRNGILSGGLFFKKIDNFIFYYKRFAHEGDPSNYGLVEITKPINGIEADVLGAELQGQFKLGFLPGFLGNFGIYSNYTYTFSEAYIYKRFPANYTDAVVIFGEDDLSLFSSDSEQEKITLPGQAKHTTNLALYYESDKFYAKISANYHDAFLYKLGADKDLDEYYDKAWHLDFTANYRITKHVRLFTDIINLTNAPLKFYLGTPEYIQKQEYYSWWGRVGVKMQF